MSWSFCIATEAARNQAIQVHPAEISEEDRDFSAEITSLSSHFSYELFYENGLLQRGLSQDEVKALEPDSRGFDNPAQWRPRNPQQLLEIFSRLKNRLAQENEQMPVDHFLWYIDREGGRWNGSTQITLPFGGIELRVPHNSMVKLEGGHRDPNHRWELRQYDVHVDADLLAQYLRETEREIESYRMQSGSKFANDGSAEAFAFVTSANLPLVEVPIRWIPVQPVLDVVGYRIEVQSIDALSSFQSDLDATIRCCEQATQMNAPLYWLIGQ